MSRIELCRKDLLAIFVSQFYQKKMIHKNILWDIFLQISQECQEKQI